MIRRLRRVDPRVWDALLALAFAGGGCAEALTVAHVPGSRAVACAGMVGIGATMLIRRAHPLAAVTAWTGVVVALALAGTTPTTFSVPFPSMLLLPFTAASRLQLSGAAAALGVVWVGIVAAAASDAEAVWGDFFFPGMFATLLWGAGRALRSRSQLTAELHEEAVRAAEAREAEAVRAIAEERRRIAREMHDVVAHSVSMMVVQAGGARRILERDPARAVAAAELIERTGRAALVEMRALLGVLHAGEEHAEYAPQPTLRELDALIDRTRAAGVRATLTVEGEARELPAGLDLAAYRVVQEALTNVIKHGGCAPTEVRVHYLADAVEVRIADRGDGAHPIRLDGSGHGLVGMRERVRMYGGELHAGRRPGGGFEVRALLPLEAEDEAALTAGART